MNRMAQGRGSEEAKGYRTVLVETSLYELIEVINEELKDEDEELATLMIFQLIEGGQLRYSRWYNN